MEDKFAIIQNDICNLSNDELISKLDNYFENLFLILINVYFIMI